MSLGLALVLLAGVARAEPPDPRDPAFLTLASTTSTETSGLFEAILPRFTETTGIQVRVVAVGTGQALRLGRRGDADLVLVHSARDEQRFVAEGYGLVRQEIMWNDFVLVGPADDPAGLGGGRDAAAGLARIARAEALFVSRGDDSGTHRAELDLWRAAGVDPAAASGRWYREAGSGMGATLNIAAGMQAYTLTDRGTWLGFRNRGGLELLLEGDPRLRNPYGAIVVSPERHPHVKAALAQRFVDWLLSPAGQAAIGAFRVEGQVLFHPARPAPGPRGRLEGGTQTADTTSGRLEP